jgi:DNA-binding transcriptional LysR family regulator
MEGCYATCLAGGGLALLSTWYVSEDVKAGRLVRLNFGEVRPETLNIWAVYPTTRLVLPKVRVFIASLKEAIAASAENFHA